MSKSIARKLAALEQQLNALVPALLEITVRGGLPGSDDPLFAGAGEMRWQRAPDETFVAFRERAVRAAMAAGERFIIIGGLPQRPQAEGTGVT